MSDRQRCVYQLHRHYGVPAIAAYQWAINGQATIVCSMYFSFGWHECVLHYSKLKQRGLRCYAVLGLSH